MKIIKNIIKTLFIFAILIETINVYGYNLHYKAIFTDVAPNGLPNTYECTVTTTVQPYPDTVKEYERRTKNSDGWVTPDTSDKSTTGGKYTFASSHYVFGTMDKVKTTYNPGFNTKSDNLTNNNVYYDTYRNAAGKDLILPDDFESISKFRGVAVNIPEDQNTDISDMYTIPKTYDSSKPIRVELLGWKVVKSPDGGFVVINKYKLTFESVNFLKEKLGEKELNEGIRFSNVLSTQFEGFPTDLAHHRTYMDTAWLYYQLTIGNQWSNGGRGFTPEWPQADNGYPGPERLYYSAFSSFPYKKGSSVVNEYDNVIKIPVPIREIKRHVYINHIDSETNAVIPGFENSNLVVTDKRKHKF